MSEEKYREEAFVQDAVDKARVGFQRGVFDRIIAALQRAGVDTKKSHDSLSPLAYMGVSNGSILYVEVKGQQVIFTTAFMVWTVNINYLEITEEQGYAAFRDTNARKTSALLIGWGKER